MSKSFLKELKRIISVQSPLKIALIKSCRLTSSFVKKQRLELHNIQLDIRVTRDTHIEFMSCTIEEIILIA